MLFRPKKNRRRLDVAKKTGELKAAARAVFPTAFKLLGLGAVTAAALWGGVQGYAWATTTDTFALRELHVRGAARATEAELARLGGLTLGTNLFALDTAAAERALGSHPWVASVTVTRRFPRAVSVEVVEHEPIAVLALGELYLVNQRGEPFKRLTPADSSDLPLVTGLDREAFLADREAALERLRRAVGLTQAYAASPAARSGPLSEVHVGPDGTFVVTTAGQQVRLPDGEWGPSLARLERIRAELKGRALTAQVIRLDNRSRPTWVSVQLTADGPERVASAGVTNPASKEPGRR